MIRTQIQLPEETVERLKSLAAQRGVSMAELVRESVELYLSRTPHSTMGEKRQRALDAAGRFQAGPEDLAENHDHYLAEDLRG